MSKIGHTKMKKISFTKLRKLEVYKFYNQVVDAVNEHATEEMHIESTCDVLIGSQPKTKLLLDESYGSHSLTPIINELKEKRFRFAAIITNHMKTVEKAEFADKQHLVALSKPLVVRYLSYLRKNNQTTVYQMVEDFFEELEGNREIKDALNELGFEPYLNELESINMAWAEAHSERVEDWSKRKKVNTLPIQRELQNNLSILFDQVDHYQHVYKDVDYLTLITALNHVIAIYTKLIKTRDTKSKNKKLKLKETEEALEEQGMDLEWIDEEESGETNEKTITSRVETPVIKTKDKIESPISSAITEKSNSKKKRSVNGLIKILEKPNDGKDDEP